MAGAKSASNRSSHVINALVVKSVHDQPERNAIRMDLGLVGAAVCVQGGSKGMGRAAAECFAAEGARVAVMARGREALDDTVTRLVELGSPDVVGLVVDASDATSIANGFAELSERWAA